MLFLLEVRVAPVQKLLHRAMVELHETQDGCQHSLNFKLKIIPTDRKRRIWLSDSENYTVPFWKKIHACVFWLVVYCLPRAPIPSRLINGFPREVPASLCFGHWIKLVLGDSQLWFHLWLHNTEQRIQIGDLSSHKSAPLKGSHTYIFMPVFFTYTF